MTASEDDLDVTVIGIPAPVKPLLAKAVVSKPVIHIERPEEDDTDDIAPIDSAIEQKKKSMLEYDKSYYFRPRETQSASTSKQVQYLTPKRYPLEPLRFRNVLPTTSTDYEHTKQNDATSSNSNIPTKSYNYTEEDQIEETSYRKKPFDENAFHRKRDTPIKTAASNKKSGLIFMGVEKPVLILEGENRALQAIKPTTVAPPRKPITTAPPTTATTTTAPSHSPFKPKIYSKIQLEFV